jgi:hypothetical protein
MPAGRPAPQGQQISPSADIVADLDGGSKAFVTLQARAAMLGYELIELGASRYILTRWGLTTRELPDLRTVAEMLRRIGGQQ